MSLRIRTLARSASALFATIGLTAAVALADDAAQGQKPAAPAPAEAPADPFAPPEKNDAESIAQFVQGMVRSFQTRGAEFRSQEGTQTYLNKIDAALAALQTRQLEADPAVLVANVRMQVLGVLTSLGDATAQQRTDGLVASLKQSEVPALKELGEQIELSAAINKLAVMEPAERAALIERIASAFKPGQELDREAVGLAQQAADTLENLEFYAESAAAYNLFAKYLEARNEERLAGLVETMRGSARRVGLVGNPIEIKGTTVDGKQFDIASWKGKVVLVDYWATWCGPCIAELPNVQKAYEAYHSKGFEVVGISLDDDADRLAAFLKERQIPWTTLFPEKEDERGWENPLARYYGIAGIPTVILVNKEGKVVSLNARGPALEQYLADLLGPVEAAPPAAPAPAPGNGK